MTDKRFCTACQSYRSADGGELRRTAKVTRWMCQDCAEKKTQSIYKAKSPTTAKTLAKIRAALYGAA